MAGEFLPGEAAVSRFVDPAARATTFASPGVNLERPHAGKQDVGITRIHHQLSGAGILINKQHPFPGLASISGTKNAALLLWSVAVAHRSGKYHIGVLRIDCDFADATGLLKPQ